MTPIRFFLLVITLILVGVSFVFFAPVFFQKEKIAEKAIASSDFSEELTLEINAIQKKFQELDKGFTSKTDSNNFYGYSAADSWQEFLIGSWNFNETWHSPKEIWIFEGTVTFLTNGNFERQISLKRYSPNVESNEARIIQDDLILTYGGSVTGTWETKGVDGWKEMRKECKLEALYKVKRTHDDYDVCSEWFSNYRSTIYGNSNNDFQFRIIEANEKRIKIKGNDFSKSSTITIEMKKQQ